MKSRLCGIFSANIWRQRVPNYGIRPLSELRFVRWMTAALADDDCSLNRW